jgi:hypothetical protein
VNLAARVQALTRIHQVDILVTETVRRIGSAETTGHFGKVFRHLAID